MKLPELFNTFPEAVMASINETGGHRANSLLVNVASIIDLEIRQQEFLTFYQVPN